MLLPRRRCSSSVYPRRLDLTEIRARAFPHINQEAKIQPRVEQALQKPSPLVKKGNVSDNPLEPVLDHSLTYIRKTTEFTLHSNHSSSRHIIASERSGVDCARARVLVHIAKLLLRVFRIFVFSLVRAVPIQECETYIYRKIGALR